jgi:hypothetical protein
MYGGISRTLSPTRLRMGPPFVFGMLFGGEKQLSSPHS